MPVEITQDQDGDMGSRSVWTWSAGDRSSEFARCQLREEQGPTRTTAHRGVAQCFPVGTGAAAATPLLQVSALNSFAVITETPLLIRLISFFIQQSFHVFSPMLFIVSHNDGNLFTNLFNFNSMLQSPWEGRGRLELMWNPGGAQCKPS